MIKYRPAGRSIKIRLYKGCFQLAKGDGWIKSFLRFIAFSFIYPCKNFKAKQIIFFKKNSIQVHSRYTKDYQVTSSERVSFKMIF